MIGGREVRMINYDSPKELKIFLEERGFSLKKRFGQNFLIAPGVRRRIIEHSDIYPGSEVWEIGPGLGAMTSLLLESGCRVKAFEIDRGFASFLKEEFGNNPSFSLILGDAVKTWLEQYDKSSPPSRVIGNLPYASGSAILLSFIKGGLKAGKFIFTLQKEVVKRITASPGDPDYSSFSILCQSVWETKNLGDLKPGSFYPAPEVISSLLEAVPHSRSPLEEAPLFQDLVRDLFSSRRKTIRNNLKSGGIAKRLPLEAILSSFEAEGVDPGRRGEELSAESIYKIALRISSLYSSPRRGE